MRYNYCPNCGFKLEEAFNFCPNCGTSVGENRLPDPAPRRGIERIEREYDYGRAPSNLDKGKRAFQDKDYPMALSFLIEYADTEDVEVLYMIGYCLYMTKKFDPSCERYLKLAADAGHPLAQATLGELYYLLAEETNASEYNPYSEMSIEEFEEARAKSESYYSLALKYLSLAKNNGVK